jgi:hypothetical protein
MIFKARSNKDSKLDLNWDRINIYVGRYKPGSPFNIEITRIQAKKSDPLRKYYFAGVCKPFMEHEGYEVDEVDLFHFQLKVTYFQHDPKGVEYNVHQDKHGIWRNVPSVFGNKSTMDVSVKKEFVDWVVRTAAKAGVYIEDPS